MSQEKLFLDHVQAGARVLAAWFDNEPFRKAWTPAADLFANDQQRACATIMALRGASLDVDGLVLGLKRQGALKHFSSVDEVYELIQGHPFELDPWAALEHLRECSALRAMRKRLQDALRVVDGGGSLSEVRNAASEALRAADVASGVKALSVQQLMQQALKEATSKDRRPGQRTISVRMDRATGGIQPGSVWVVAAGFSWGKSSFSCAVVDQTQREGRRVLYVSAEDPPQLFGRRLLQYRTHVDGLRLRDGNLNREERDTLTAEIQRASRDPAYIDGRGRKVESIAADIYSLCVSERIDVVLVDYVQALTPKVPQQDRRNEINYCARQIFDAIKSGGAGGILFSQLTEDANGRRKARDSEDLHNMAECLMFGIKEKEAKVGADGVKQAEIETRALWIEKTKDGPAGFRVELDWHPSAACFLSDYRNDANRELPFPDGTHPDDYAN